MKAVIRWTSSPETNCMNHNLEAPTSCLSIIYIALGCGLSHRKMAGPGGFGDAMLTIAMAASYLECVLW